MAFVPERSSPGRSHSAYLETKDALYHLMSCVEGLIPRITGRRERREIFELIARLERLLIELMMVEEFDHELWDAIDPRNGEADPRPPDPPSG